MARTAYHRFLRQYIDTHGVSGAEARKAWSKASEKLKAEYKADASALHKFTAVKAKTTKAKPRAGRGGRGGGRSGRASSASAYSDRCARLRKGQCVNDNDCDWTVGGKPGCGPAARAIQAKKGIAVSKVVRKGDRLYKVRKAQCVAPTGEWFTGEGCYALGAEQVSTTIRPFSAWRKGKKHVKPLPPLPAGAKPLPSLPIGAKPLPKGVLPKPLPSVAIAEQRAGEEKMREAPAVIHLPPVPEAPKKKDTPVDVLMANISFLKAYAFVRGAAGARIEKAVLFINEFAARHPRIEKKLEDVVIPLLQMQGKMDYSNHDELKRKIKFINEQLAAVGLRVVYGLPPPPPTKKTTAVEKLSKNVDFLNAIARLMSTSETSKEAESFIHGFIENDQHNDRETLQSLLPVIMPLLRIKDSFVVPTHLDRASVLRNIKFVNQQLAAVGLEKVVPTSDYILGDWAVITIAATYGKGPNQKEALRFMKKFYAKYPRIAEQLERKYAEEDWKEVDTSRLDMGAAIESFGERMAEVGLP